MRSLAIVLVLSVLFLTGCASVMTPAMGLIYTDVKAPLAATSNPTATKSGTAHLESYLGLVALGDASIETAARNAGITKIHHVDYKSMSILGIYGKLTVIVYGE